MTYSIAIPDLITTKNLASTIDSIVTIIFAFVKGLIIDAQIVMAPTTTIVTSTTISDLIVLS